MSVEILIGDAIERLRELPANSVHMCVTSPPYWGLRDYGTGEWEGGDPACGHFQGRPGAGRADGIVDERAQRNRDGAGAFKTTCKCGARRVDQQIGLEPTPEQWAARLVEVFHEVKRVLRPDGTLWLNIGDSYASGEIGRHDSVQANAGNGWTGTRKFAERQQRRAQSGTKPKDLVGQPWLLALALRADGWWLRSEIIWAKPNPMPESVRDRPTKAHEQVFLLRKSERYFFDQEAIRENGTNRAPGNVTHKGALEYANGDEHHRTKAGLIDIGASASRNARSVWTIATEPFSGSHFATMPTELVRRCILAGTSAKGCCPQCAAPWQRVVEREITNREGWGGPSNPLHGTPNGTHGPSHRGEGRCGDSIVLTTGWSPTCGCDAGAPVPCTVLDPFGGSGTTALVADQLGRNAILIELNPQYAEMARRRIGHARARRAIGDVTERHEPLPGQTELPL